MEIFQGIDETKDRRVQNVMIGGEALDPNKTYTVAGSCYTLQEQGDGFSMFQGAEVVEQEGLPVDSEMLINYFTEELDGKVTAEQYGNPLGDGRITILTEAQAGTEDPENPSGDPGDEPAGGSENGNTDDKNSNGSDGSVKPVQTGDDSRIWPIAHRHGGGIDRSRRIRHLYDQKKKELLVTGEGHFILMRCLS